MSQTLGRENDGFKFINTPAGEQPQQIWHMNPTEKHSSKFTKNHHIETSVDPEQHQDQRETQREKS